MLNRQRGDQSFASGEALGTRKNWRRYRYHATTFAGQAYTLLVSVWCWRKLNAASNGGLVIVGDALGVVHDAFKLRSKGQILNLLMGDLALDRSPHLEREKSDLRQAQSHAAQRSATRSAQDRQPDTAAITRV